jgi:hypothetical protein
MIADIPVYLPWLALVALLLLLRWSFWPNKQVGLPITEQQEIAPSRRFGAPISSAELYAPSGVRPDALDAIRQVMPTVGNASDPLELPPQMPIWKAVKRVAKVLGDTDRQGGYPATLDAIRQAALDGRIEIWGKRELPPPMEPGLSSDEWTPINPMFWRTHQINSLASDKMSEGCLHTCSNPLIYGEQNGCWSLRVRLPELEKIWAKA